MSPDFWPKSFAEWRPIPRLLVFLYGIVFYQVVSWFMGLESPNGAQATFVSVVVGAGAAFFNFYVNSGPDKPQE